MEITFQGLRILLPFEGVIGAESFTMDASFNTHVSVELMLLVEEENIETAIHGIADGDDIKVYEDGMEGLLFAGKITDVKMQKERSFSFLVLEASSYTMEWELAPVSQSFLNLDATYKQVMEKVLENQPQAEIMDCVTQGAVIPDFLLQYEESDWDFLSRLASYFLTYLVPDCHAEHGRAYFGLPDFGEEFVLSEEEYQETKDMDQHYRIGYGLGILPQENLKWEVSTNHSFCLAQKICFRGISTIVTKVCYRTIKGELVRFYELSRRKGMLCEPKKNPNIFGMSIPATVKERSGNCVRVHFHIDKEYDSASNIKYFPYAIESSFIYCMPEVGSQVHIYFPSDDESDAIAVHAIRTSASKREVSNGSYAQIPDNKSFSSVSGAELTLAPSFAGIFADQEQETCITIDTEGNASITGKMIEIRTEKSLSIGEPSEEGGQPSQEVSLMAKVLTMQVGEAKTQINLTEEAKIYAAFIRLEASDRTPAEEPSAKEMLESVTAGDEDARKEINEGASTQLVEKYEQGRAQILQGIIKIAATVATVVVAMTLTVVTGGAAAALLGPMMLATYGFGAGVVAFAVSDIGEGIDSMEKAQRGDLTRGHNVLRDDVFKNETLYNIVKTGVDIGFGIVSGKAIGSAMNAAQAVGKIGKIACGSSTLRKIESVMQVGSNVVSAGLNDLITTGKIDPKGLVTNIGIGMLQGMIGGKIADGILDKLGITGKSTAALLSKITVNSLVDTGMDGVVSKLFGQEFDFWDSLARNAFTNTLSSLISDPVDAATGMYVINTTDFILASVPESLKLERTYHSTCKTVSCLGRGWSFPYASRIYRDTKDTEHTRIHMEAITGHSLCFEKQENMWVNQSRGTARFLLEVREDAGFPEEEAFLLSDVVAHTLCAYDRQGQLRYVEYPNHQRLIFAYGKEGLQRITTPLGNILEVESREGRIFQITDEIGRRTQYRYEGDYLVDVVHTDEGITHYEYDENGHITAVTDQNGSRYLENEYDTKGRITRQSFPDSICQTFTYDDAHRRNTIHYSETGKTEVYEYNKELLTERIIYEDKTFASYEYSKQNLKTKETGRTGAESRWEYDSYGRLVYEVSPEGFETHYEYDKNHDMVHTWDSDGQETQNHYDQNHNLILIREKITEKQWKETAREYDSRGRLTVERDSLGNATLWEYAPDSAHPVRFITPKGEETTYEYDRVGRRMSISNSYGTVALSYNSRNFVTRRTDGEGYTSYSFYDRMGNMTTYYSPRQWEEKGEGYEYHRDYLERIVDIISPLKEHQRVYRNFDGDIIRSIHPVSYAQKEEDGKGTRYQYDNDGNCTHIYYADGGTERRFYDADGNMTKQVLPEAYDASIDDGEGFCYAYDHDSRLIQIQNPNGDMLHCYEYNGHGQIVKETDGEGQETRYTYNGLGLLTRQQTSTRSERNITYYRVTAYAYDSQGNKIEEAYGQQEVEEDKNPSSWHRIYFSYDQNNHLTYVKDGFGAQIHYEYDCLGNVTLEEKIVEEGIQSRIHYTYNKNGWRIQKTEEIQGNGEINKAVTSYGYDADGNQTSIQTPKGAAIRMEYDAAGRMIQERVIDKKNGIDKRTSYTYDAAGNILSQTITGADGECLKTGWSYDLKDRLTQEKNQNGAVTRYLYDQNDQLIKEIQPYESDTNNGKGTSYTYDKNGNIVQVTNSLGELVQELSYNRTNHPITQKDAFGNQTEFAYELDGQIKEIRRGNSIRQKSQRTLQQYEYNARGQVVGIIDGNHEKVTYDVDSWGRITGTGFSDGVREGYEYTPSGQVSKTIDGNGNAIQYHYNSLGKVRERIDQLGYQETFEYDEEGNLALHTDRDGRKVQRIYNVFGSPVYEKATDAEGGNACISTWRYDSLGRLVRAVCDGHSYEYAYDGQGNLKEKRSNGKRLVSYAYNEIGQIKEIKDLAGVSTCYEYDLLGRISRIHNAEGMEVQYKYDSLDRIEKIRCGNRVETTYAYDCDGNISQLETKAGETVLLSFAYKYDGNGNRTVKAGIQGLTEGSNALAINYQYDIRGQLLEEKRNDLSVCYAYDAAGNRIKKTDGKKKTNYSYNEKNQLLYEEESGNKKWFTYDNQGGIVEEKNPAGIRRFRYNSKHQQTWIETEDGKIQENRYDAEGLRYELLENGKRTSFVYHNGELLYEKGGEAGLSEETSYHLGAGIEAFQRNHKIFYYHQDEQLSTALVTDGRGEIKNQYQYDAFGVGMEAIEELPNRIRYTGQQYDQQTEQYYLRARYYNPVLGRFMQEDVYQGDGLNLYAYCGNNPVVYYDPSGYALSESDLNKLKHDIDGLNYPYYQNKTYNPAYKNSAYSDYYRGYALQAHHLLQGEWARINLKKYGYDYNKAPTITLETGYYEDASGKRIATPHTIVNNRQNERHPKNNRNFHLTTLDQELIYGAQDLIIAGMSEKLVLSELERNYKMIDHLNKENKKNIDSGTLEKLKYNRKKIEKAVHETAKQKQLEDESIQSTSCNHTNHI